MSRQYNDTANSGRLPRTVRGLHLSNSWTTGKKRQSNKLTDRSAITLRQPERRSRAYCVSYSAGFTASAPAEQLSVAYLLSAATPTLHGKKVAHTRLPSIGFRSRFPFLAVSLQVTRVINPALGCQYFPPRPQLPQQPLRGLLSVLLLGEQRHDGCEQFA